MHIIELIWFWNQIRANVRLGILITSAGESVRLSKLRHFMHSLFSC